ncbi:uncharacterized protein PRCAT00005492001 [Priceomyces carsonii]|uniref:uncharacterized protein n=1 Tax=Priceomyces carsonii TaxID=28549 RepID=UPI002ED82795|nr:unnamed protein product [Priceomyces carsonii]
MMLCNRININNCMKRVQLSGSRYIHTRSVLRKGLPSSPEMKSNEPWSNERSENATANSKSSITSKVVGIARSLQENTQPPINIDSQYTRKFSLGDTYDPFDLSSDKLDIERREARTRANSANRIDKFDRAGIDPLDLYTMPEILSGFLTSTGQILPREVTGCNAKNQKKLGIAIKRARSCGLLASVHKYSRYLPQRNM